ncbi:MAG: hypothetical protein U1E17_02400 [Geminicoccaceae bacterium]
MAYLALGLAAALLCYLGLRWFARVSPRDLAVALRAFAAAFSALASTGLLLTGRLGLALITLAATVMAVRTLVQGQRGADPWRAAGSTASTVETRLLAMRLDHATGEVQGTVRAGGFAGRELAGMAMAELLALLQEARRQDPDSVSLIEAYLERRDPAWRAHAPGGAGAAGPDGNASGAGNEAGAMDERTARAILGVGPDADAAAIRAAHRQLMARLHPDHGGSSFLASQINRARDYLLRARPRHDDHA